MILPYVNHSGRIGLPLYWSDETSGELPAAVKAYFRATVGESPGPTASQLELVCGFCIYFIQAPCWDHVPDAPDDYGADLAALRERARGLASVESIKRWTEECKELGIDPW